MKAQYKETEDKMKKTIATLEHEYSSIRAGRANASALDKITVDYYGTKTHVSQLASISSPEARILVIQPYDATILKGIEKAIQASDLGINPQNDGKLLRLNFPPLTEERRKEIVKNIHKLAEDSKISIRSIRRESIEKYKDQKKKSKITEDDLKDAEKDIQDATDKICKDIDVLSLKKEKEILDM